MLVDAKRRRLRDVLDHDLEPIVAERFHLPAVATDEMVVVIASRSGRLVVGAAAAQLQTVDEPKLGKRLERAVDARDPHSRSLLAHLLVDLGRCEAAALLREHIDHSGSRRADLEARLTECELRVLIPGHRL